MSVTYLPESNNLSLNRQNNVGAVIGNMTKTTVDKAIFGTAVVLGAGAAACFIAYLGYNLYPSNNQELEEIVIKGAEVGVGLLKWFGNVAFIGGVKAFFKKIADKGDEKNRTIENKNKLFEGIGTANKDDTFDFARNFLSTFQIDDFSPKAQDGIYSRLYEHRNGILKDKFSKTAYQFGERSGCNNLGQFILNNSTRHTDPNLIDFAEDLMTLGNAEQSKRIDSTGYMAKYAEAMQAPEISGKHVRRA